MLIRTTDAGPSEGGRSALTASARVRGERQSAPPTGGSAGSTTIRQWLDFSVVVHGDLCVNRVLIEQHGRVQRDDHWSEARVDDPAIDMAAHLMVFGEEGSRSSSSRMKRPGPGWPQLAHHIMSLLAFGAVTYALFASTRVTKSTSLRRRRSSPGGMSERRYSPLATLFAAAFLAGSATRWRPSRFHGSSLSHTRARPGRAPRPLAASRDHHRRVGWWWPRRSVQARARRIDLGCGGRRGHGRHPLLDAVSALSNTGRSLAWCSVPRSTHPA